MPKCQHCNGLGILHDGPERVSCRECFGTGEFVSTVTFKASARTWRRAARNAEERHPHLCQLMRDAAFLCPDDAWISVTCRTLDGGELRWYRNDAELSERIEARAA